METAHNMKMEIPNRLNRVQMPTLKNETISDGAPNVLAMDANLVANYTNDETSFISIMEIKNEFAGNVQ